jgi:FtsH-binding integral membrane protein
MIEIFIQMTVTQDAIEYLVLLMLTLVAMVMGLYVVFQAYRGYRRNSSQQMLFLAIGFAFLTVIPFTLSLVVAGISQRFGIPSQAYMSYLAITSRGLEICGLGAILYSLYSRR